MWRELVSGLCNDVTFFPAASSKDVVEAGRTLGAPLPDDLAEMLLESDGIEGEYGLGLVWPLSRIIQDNLAFRSNREFKTIYMSFDSLMFFADAGNGDQFAYTVLGGRIRRPDIYVWNHEDDSRTWFAASLERYLHGWLIGDLQV